MRMNTKGREKMYDKCFYADDTGCPNYKPASAPVEKEEWVDCTREYLASGIIDGTDVNGFYSCRYGAYPSDSTRIVTNNSGPFFRFRIERRVVKKVCKECGKEI
jgi:hypothetical protein